VIGDVDPEDGYDAGDPIPERLRVLALIAGAYRDDDRRIAVRRSNLARLIRNVADDIEYADG
jgi:hypothetical protein